MSEPTNPLGIRIEHASLNAWPALHQVLSDGWLARFCGGFTKRANSVSVVASSSTPLAEHIDWCAALYRQKHLQPVFRLTDLGIEPGLEAALALRGYQRLDPTAVLVGDAGDIGGAPGASADFALLSPEEWLDHYTRLADSPAAAQRLHGLLLGAIQLPCAFGVIQRDHGVVACGLAVREGDLVGLFDIVTHPAQRRRGYGEQLTRHLVRWGNEHGARHAYLQVLDANRQARRIYDRLGFSRSHGYWYRVAGEPAPPSPP